MEPSARLEGYEILEPIGSGGMGHVYLAEDLRHHRRVAIKMLRPEISSMLGEERFQSEIQITAGLQHPHILPLFDSGVAGDYVFYVMPYIEGESLRQRLDRDGRLGLDEALEIARQVGAALQHAHEHGVVHRDIKPENIMLQPGHAIVADFGIALAFADGERTRLTAGGGSIGTPGYMSPEQAAGESDIDERSDIYALGALLYEMVSGRRPFIGESLQQVVQKVLAGNRPPVRELVPDLAEDVASAVERAMAVEREDRYATADAFVKALTVPAPVARGVSRSTSRLVGVVAAASLAIVGWFGWQWRQAEAQRTWARMEAIPEVQRLLTDGNSFAALQLALEAGELLPGDPTVAALVDAASDPVALLDSNPRGALVTYRDYVRPSDWVELGTTPVEDVVVPDQHLILRFTLDGHRTHERAYNAIVTPRVNVELAAEDDPDDMVVVSAGAYALSESPVVVPSFRIDRLEVTNADFQAFLDNGAYGDLESWPEHVGDASGFDAARAAVEFVDTTGQPGPATWQLRRYPEGRANHPVRGISWFEAAAYCASTGKTLPTYFHWKQAAGVEAWNSMNVASQVGGDGPVAAGSTGAVGPHGAVDMAGNVREWVWNSLGDLRYVLGGAWDEAAYLFAWYEAIDPWQRPANAGFRCARYDGAPAAELVASIDQPYFDFTDIEPVDDATFDLYATFYRYDPAPLNATREVIETTDDWIREKVEFDAAYSGKRVPAHVYLPRGVDPPYQSVVVFPGLDAFLESSSENLSSMHWLEFLPRSGRALVFPILEGHYERRVPPDARRTPASRRDLTIAQTRDIMRTVDYIVERPDLDAEAIGYLGLSYGAELSVPVALEKRFSALVLVGAALDAAWRTTTAEEAAPWNFVFRITTPSILINGSQDVMHPYEEGQLPFFNAIDVPDEDKRLVVSEAGHLPPFNEIIRHSLEWLDEHLGEVERRPR